MSQHRESEIHTSVRWFLFPFFRVHEVRTHGSVLSMRMVSTRSFPFSFSRRADIYEPATNGASRGLATRHPAPKTSGPRPGIFSISGGEGQAGPSPFQPLRGAAAPRILPGFLFVLIRTLFVHVAGFGAFSSTFPGRVRPTHAPLRRKPVTIGPFSIKRSTRESRRAGPPASKSTKRKKNAQQASFEREKKRSEGPRGSQTAASERTTRESGRKRNGSAFPKKKDRTKGEESGCLIPRSWHESSSTSKTERKRKRAGWKTRRDCTIRR